MPINIGKPEERKNNVAIGKSIIRKGKAIQEKQGLIAKKRTSSDGFMPQGVNARMPKGPTKQKQAKGEM